VSQPGRRTSRNTFLFSCILLAASVVGCEKQQWQVGEDVRAPDVEVAAALGDTSQANNAGLAAADIPVIAYPRRLRPCCLFGVDLTVAVERVRVPGIEIGKLLSLGDIGPHRYDNGYLSLQTDDPRGMLDKENNGLIYTCRGGFIDLAHVRDNADNTLALTAAVARSLETGGVYDVPPQGATMRVRLRPVSEDALKKYGRIQLAVVLARWVAYQFSIWHEIATFYNYASVKGWPEKDSAFSPEDLYSNQIGARISGGIILAKGARTAVDYDLNMDAWIKRTLERLGAVALKDSQSAMHELDSAWWDSTKPIPDWRLVRRRQFHTGPYLRPWRLEDARPGSKGAVKPLASCRDAAPPLVLQVVDGFAGALFKDYATVEFEVHDSLVAQGFPLPRAGNRLVTQEDFATIIEKSRRVNAETFGPVGDAP
jgi:hypothetical protein